METDREDFGSQPLRGRIRGWAQLPSRRDAAQPKPSSSTSERSARLRGWRCLESIEEAKLLASGNGKDQLIDMRSWEQYIGKTSGYSYVEKAGRIPNTLWCAKEHWYLNPDETMGNPEEMLNHWKQCGIDLQKRSVFFCGAGAW